MGTLDLDLDLELRVLDLDLDLSLGHLPAAHFRGWLGVAWPLLLLQHGVGSSRQVGRQGHKVFVAIARSCNEEAAVRGRSKGL